MSILLGIVLAVVSPASRPSTGPTTAPAGWKLAWADEFDHDGAPDPSIWQFEKGYIRNKEAQFYTDRAGNCRVEDGCLVIEARKESIPVSNKGDEKTTYTSASIEARGQHAFTYGRVEVRAKLPAGRGTWPAIWMLGDGIARLGWPDCGEIDIMENVGFEPDVLHGSIHTKAYNHVIHTENTRVTPVEKMADEFHVYAMEWTPQKIDLFVDGRKYFTFENEHKTEAQWPFARPQYLKLNLAIGGAWGGQKGIDDSIFPQKFLVDYVRVYKQR